MQAQNTVRLYEGLELLSRMSGPADQRREARHFLCAKALSVCRRGRPVASGRVHGLSRIVDTTYSTGRVPCTEYSLQ